MNFVSAGRNVTMLVEVDPSPSPTVAHDLPSFETCTRYAIG
jgi:hypothetical protein